MKKLILLCITALLFVGCGKAKVETEQTTLDAMGLSLVKPVTVQIQEAPGNNVYLLSETFRVMIMNGPGYAEATLKDALAKPGSKKWENLAGEEVEGGYYITYDQKMGDQTSMNVLARLTFGDKTYFLNSTASNKKDLETCVEMIKSVKSI